MSGISAKTVEKFLNQAPWKKIADKAPNATKGSRLYPSNMSKDSPNNFRLDRGSTVDGVPEVVMQANIKAADAGVRAAANKNSHAILAKATLSDNTAADLLKNFRDQKK